MIHLPAQAVLLVAALMGAARASAQESFDLQFDHATILVTDLETSADFYEGILHLKLLETPWGPAAPIRFFSLGAGRQLHMGLTESSIEPNRNVHLALTVLRFDDYLRFLEERGIAFGTFADANAEPQVRPDGVRQVYLQDPDGNWIEINDAVHPPR
jgi:catechol 2,3-dioxygenase-like lactoylglutathione lyase family enzyme